MDCRMCRSDGQAGPEVRYFFTVVRLSTELMPRIRATATRRFSRSASVGSVPESWTMPCEVVTRTCLAAGESVGSPAMARRTSLVMSRSVRSDDPADDGSGGVEGTRFDGTALFKRESTGAATEGTGGGEGAGAGGVGIACGAGDSRLQAGIAAESRVRTMNSAGLLSPAPANGNSSLRLMFLAWGCRTAACGSCRRGASPCRCRSARPRHRRESACPRSPCRWGSQGWG